MLDLNYILCFALWEWFLFCVFFLNQAPHLPCVLKLVLLSASQYFCFYIHFLLTCLNINISYLCAVDIHYYYILSYSLANIYYFLVAFKDSDQGLLAAQIQRE